MFGVGIFVTFAQRYKLSGTTGIARGLPLKLKNIKTRLTGLNRRMRRNSYEP